MDNRISPFDCIAYSLCQVLPLLVQMSGQRIPWIFNAQQETDGLQSGDRAKVFLLHKRDDLAAEEHGAVTLVQQPERFVDSERQTVEVLHHFRIGREEVLLPDL